MSAERPIREYRSLQIPQPCDPQLGGGAFGDGYKAGIQFSHISGDVASGTVTSGNVLPAGTSVTATLVPGGMLDFSGVAPGRTNRLCGSKVDAATGTCGA